MDTRCPFKYVHSELRVSFQWRKATIDLSMFGLFALEILRTESFLCDPKWQYSILLITHQRCTWWRHQMETFSALLAICAGNSPVSGEFPAQRPVTRSFDVFFDLRLDGRLSKHSWGWWLETPSCPLWRQSNEGKQGWDIEIRATHIRHLIYSPHVESPEAHLCLYVTKITK